MLQDKIIMTAMERAGAMNWLTAANSIMAAGKKAVTMLETVAGEGEDTGVLPVAEMLKEAEKTVSSACDRCRRQSICPRKCSVNLFLEDLEGLLKTN